jgi:L-2-hydroxyglutarate oxidase LhgO
MIARLRKRRAIVESADCVVIGAGIVGLAIARELAAAGRDVLVLEAEDAIGTHTSSRNSEVIHAGLYYPPGSLKAKLCVEGRAALYAYCAARGIPHRTIGKIVVATDASEVERVEGYAAAGRANGVDDLRLLTSAELRALEPDVRCIAGFLSPSTGIVDGHALMLALIGDAEHHGAKVVLRAPVVGGEVRRDAIRLDVGGTEPTTLQCAAVINAAGLLAQDLARSIRGFPAAHIPRRYFAKAHYFVLSGRSPFRRLVYPVASEAHLGVHVTLDLAGEARFGPDVSWVDRVDYAFDSAREPLFREAIRRYYPALRDDALRPGYTGIRPKVVGPGEPAGDFVIEGPRHHGVGGLVNLFGIESPGLTASLAIAGYVVGLID